jgi:DNA-binding MarR family transcriptional regulator
LSRYNMTPPQLFLLLALYERDDVPAGELAGRVHLDKSTLTGILIRLEKTGLITRTSDENDGRSVRVALTEKGHKMRRPLTALYQDVNRRVLDTIGASESSLLALLTALEKAAPKV